MLAVPFGLFVALFLNQTVTGIRLVKSLFFFPFVISQVVVGLVFAWFYDPNNGLLNIVIGWFGMDPVSILADEDLVTWHHRRRPVAANGVLHDFVFDRLE